MISLVSIVFRLLCAALLVCAVRVSFSGDEGADAGVYLTRDESKHVGAVFSPRSVVYQFNSTKLARSGDVKVNDFLGHHALARRFCKERAQKSKTTKCTWQDYYTILDELREPFANFFDPGATISTPIKEIYDNPLPKRLVKARKPGTCDTITNPSAKDLLKLARASHPTIIKGVASKWRAVKDWNLKYMKKKWGHMQVVTSITPTGDFDGPEDPKLWGVKGNDTVLIVRPAHEQMTLAELIDYSVEARKDNVTHYLEYFPLAALGGEEAMNSVFSMKVANFMQPRFTLLWMGMAGVTEPTGRLHFDRFENIMAVVAGRKRFHIFGPDQGENVYAATPLRSATYSFERNNAAAAGRAGGKAKAGGKGRVLRSSIGKFYRDPGSVSQDYSDFHTYSPVDVKNPNYTLFPKFKKAKGLICDINRGEMLYLPTDWWHEVTSYMDDEGKNIGVNIFYEPLFRKPGYLTLKNDFLDNRYYSHITETREVDVCSKSTICFADEAKKKSKSSKKSKKSKKSKRRAKM